MSRMGLYEQLDACVVEALAEITGREADFFRGFDCVAAKDACMVMFRSMLRW